jgi:prevent-host-death family protein
MDEISVEKARPKLGDLVRDAQRYGITTRITLNGKPAAVLVPVLTDLAARARTLAGLADEAALRQHTGETDGVLACVRALGEAKDLLGAMADRLDPPGQATEENHG